MTVLPPEIKFGRVVGRWIAAVGDTGQDQDYHPDVVVPAGSISFTRIERTTVREDTTQQDGTFVGIFKKVINCRLDDTGELCTIDGDPVWLITGGYSVNATVDGTNWPIDNIVVSETHDNENPLDLIKFTPLVETPTVLLVPSYDTMVRAEAAADRAEAAADLVSGMNVVDTVIEYLEDHPVDADPAGTAEAKVVAHEQKGDPHPQYVTESELPDPPDLSGYVTSDDARLSDARTPLAHEHPEYLTEADLPDLSDVIREGDARLGDARTPLAHEHPEYLTEADLPAPPDLSGYVTNDDARLTDARTPTAHGHEVTDVTGLADILAGKSDTDHSHTWDTITAKPSTFPPSGHNHDTSYYTKAQSDAALDDLSGVASYLGIWLYDLDAEVDDISNWQSSLPVLRQRVVTVPNVGWADSVTLSVNGLTGVHWVSPVTAADAATWAAGNWWASSPTDGQLVITGDIQPTSDPVNIRVVWWGEKEPL